MRVHFGHDVDVVALAELAEAAQDCCSFLRFNIRIGADGVSMDVTGPDEARDVIASVFGRPHEDRDENKSKEEEMT